MVQKISISLELSSLEYTEAEEGGDGPLCPGGGNAADTITGTTMHGV